MKSTVTVQQHDNEEDLFIEFPEELMQELGWEEGDLLNWEIQDDNKIIITKVNDTTKSKQEPTIADYDWYTVKEEAINEHIEDTTLYEFIDHSAIEVFEDIQNAEDFLAARDQDTEQSQDRTVPPPSNFPYFP